MLGPTLSGMTTSALLVIDVQESFRHRPYFRPDDVAPFLGKLQQLIDGAVARGIPVVQVLHVEDTGVFSLASGHVTTMAGVAIEPAVVVHKHSHSALVGSRLDEWLKRRGIGRLIVSGIRTEQCCETTARHGFDTGYEVAFVTEATLTFPITDRGGRVWSPAEIQARTELVLHDRFAQIVDVATALDGEASRLSA
jgi:nicotinamidase-related amidase